MTKLSVVALSLTGVLVLASLGMMALAKNQAPAVSSNSLNLYNLPLHEVSNDMEATAANLAKSKAPDFTLPMGNGEDFHLLDQLAKTPVLLVFTKDKCPCSLEAQTFFSQLAKHYQPKVTFLGVMDGDKHEADRYETDFSVPYHFAYSESKDFFRNYHTKQGAYQYLINQDGTLNKVWPGYSKDSLLELDQKLSKMTGIPPLGKFDQWEDAPNNMVSGCYFFTDVGAQKPSW